MMAAKIQGQKWLREYQIEDLSRCLIRQFLIQNNLSQTLKCFESEDTKFHKKINKSVLIKLLSMNNLAYNNKNSHRPYKSLLDILVNYLRDKFKKHIQGGVHVGNDSDVQTFTNKTQVSNDNYKQRNDSLNRIPIDKSMNNTFNLSNSRGTHNNSNKDNNKIQQINNNFIYQRKINNQFNSNKVNQKKKRPVTSGHKAFNQYNKYNQHNHHYFNNGNNNNKAKIKNVQLIYAELAKQDQKQQERLMKVNEQKKKIQEQKRKRIQIQEEIQRKRKVRQQQEKQRQKQRQRQLQKQKQRQRQKQRALQQQKMRQIEKKIQKEKQQKQKQEKQRIQRQKLQKIQKQRKQKQQRQKKQRQQKQKIRKKQEQQKQKQRKQKQQELQIQKAKEQKLLKQKQLQQQKLRKQAKQKQEKKKKQQLELELRRKKEQQQKQIQIQKQLQLKQKQKEIKQVQAAQVNKEQAKFILQQKQPVAVPQKSTRMVGMRKLGKKKQPQSQIKIENNTAPPQVQVNATEVKPVQNMFVLQQNIPKPQKSNTNNTEQQKILSQKKQQGQKMVTIFGKKKKANNEEKQDNEPKKFKFDQNFVDEPLYAQAQKYNYQKIVFNKIIVKDPIEPQINYKDKFAISGKKFSQKSITQAQAQQLKKAVFQSGPSTLPKSWFQGFILSPHPSTPYGLQQIEGGPCGIIAAIQCYYLKHLLALANLTEQQMSNQQIRQNCLVAAITDMLLKCKSTDKIVLCLPPKSFSGTKIDLSNLRIVSIDADSFSQAFEGIYQHKSYFIGKSNHGVSVLMYCIVMTKGIQKIWQQIDMKENPLIGHHGHCTQQLVNLFITGYASSNCFDGTKILDSQIKLKGIQNKSQFGFLTIFQTLKYIQVGKNLKNPIYPFWIICKQFHYHVIFANHYLIAENNNCEKFDMVYFDGLYNCSDKIVITLQAYPYGEEVQIKVKDLPLIQQVMMTKWGNRKADWNGSIKIL